MNNKIFTFSNTYWLQLFSTTMYPGYWKPDAKDVIYIMAVVEQMLFELKKDLFVFIVATVR